MDYRRRWCRLVEILDPDEDLNFMKALFETTLNCRQPFAQLSRLKPELLVKRTGMITGSG